MEISKNRLEVETLKNSVGLIQEVAYKIEIDIVNNHDAWIKQQGKSPVSGA